MIRHACSRQQWYTACVNLAFSNLEIVEVKSNSDIQVTIKVWINCLLNNYFMGRKDDNKSVKYNSLIPSSTSSSFPRLLASLAICFWYVKISIHHLYVEIFKLFELVFTEIKKISNPKTLLVVLNHKVCCNVSRFCLLLHSSLENCLQLEIKIRISLTPDIITDDQVG